MRELAEAPGNARIAAALLDVLSASGSASLRARAEKALEGGGPPRGRRSGWIAIEHLRDGFRAAAVDPPLARRRRPTAAATGCCLASNAGIASHPPTSSKAGR